MRQLRLVSAVLPGLEGADNLTLILSLSQALQAWPFFVKLTDTERRIRFPRNHALCLNSTKFDDFRRLRRPAGGTTMRQHWRGAGLAAGERRAALAKLARGGRPAFSLCRLDFSVLSDYNKEKASPFESANRRATQKLSFLCSALAPAAAGGVPARPEKGGSPSCQ